MSDRWSASRLTDAAVDRLAASVKGVVLRADDAGYEDSRRVFNAMIDRHPPVILRAADAADVVAAVRFARDHDVLVSVKGGGHSISGHAVHDHALMLAMGEMRSTQVEPDLRLATVGGGRCWPISMRPRARPGWRRRLAWWRRPVSPGWRSVEGSGGCRVSTAWPATTWSVPMWSPPTASWVRADAEQHLDLFWALRGGSGNFGVVTSFSFRLHPVEDIFADHPYSYAAGVRRDPVQHRPQQLQGGVLTG